MQRESNAPAERGSGRAPRTTDVALMADAVESGWNRTELFRLCITEYPRRFHGASRAERRRMVTRRPRLTNSAWDAAIGTSIEHVCLTHGRPPPTWTDEPERFRTGPEVLLWQLSATVLCHLPAPFTRRGIVIDARNLDARTVDEKWRPDIGDPDERWPRRSEQAEDTRLSKPAVGLKESEGTRRRLDEACRCIESEALRSGWALRVCLAQRGGPAKTFALRGRKALASSIVVLEESQTRGLIRRALARSSTRSTPNSRESEGGGAVRRRRGADGVWAETRTRDDRRRRRDPPDRGARAPGVDSRSQTQRARSRLGQFRDGGDPTDRRGH